MRRSKSLVIVAPAIVAATAIVAVGIGPAAFAQDPAPFDEARALLASELNTIDIIDRFGPSVVAVNVAVPNQEASRLDGLPEDEVPDDFRRFQEFFGEEGFVQRSNGSGFLIEFGDEPYLVTNFHVVEGALTPETSELLAGAEISVTFPVDADENVAVDVVGVNPSFDLALLQLLDADQLPLAEALTIADSDGLETSPRAIQILAPRRPLFPSPVFDRQMDAGSWSGSGPRTLSVEQRGSPGLCKNSRPGSVSRTTQRDCTRSINPRAG